MKIDKYHWDLVRCDMNKIGSMTWFLVRPILFLFLLLVVLPSLVIVLLSLFHIRLPIFWAILVIFAGPMIVIALYVDKKRKQRQKPV